MLPDIFMDTPKQPGVTMDSSANDLTSPSHVRRYSTPRCYDNIVGKLLTDRRIAYYQKRGWYDADAKAARKERAEKRLKKQNRTGNFKLEEGRLIYCP
jgi:hypothetical protein